MKKTLTLFFVLILFSVWAAGCGKTPASADKTPEAEVQPSAQPAVTEQEPTPAAVQKTAGPFEARSSDGVIEVPDFGMKITLPEAVRDIPVLVNGYVQDDYAVANLCLADESNPDNQNCVFGEIVAYPEEKQPGSIVDEDAGITEEMIMGLGSNQALNYYALRLDELRRTSPEKFEQIMEGLSEDQRRQYEALIEALPDVIGGVELTEMTVPEQTETAGSTAEEEIMDYVLPDLYGNEGRLGDLIMKNRVTMINIWGISCGPCMMEMPYLARLRDSFKDQGFEIIGITADLLDSDGGIDPVLAEEAKNIAADLGVGYPVLAMPLEIRNRMHIYAVPTTLFVTSTGQVIGEQIMGSRPEGEWERLILNALAAAN